jgi:two-component system, NtrC family, sensor histidine kinase HydH
MQRIRKLPPRSKLLISGLVILAVTITIFAWFEVSRSREELLRFVETEAELLIETVNRSTATTMMANAELERAIVQRLQLAARIVDMQSSGTSASALAKLAKDIEVDRIMMFDVEGNVIATDTNAEGPLPFRIDSMDVYSDLLRPVLDGGYAWLAEGGKRLPSSAQQMFVLVQERERGDGAVLLGISSAAMLEMRLRLGIGTLLRDIGSASSIAYVVLQDDHGILTASVGVVEMGPIASDTFLVKGLQSDSTRSRLTEHAGEPVFEVVKRLRVDGDEIALMRIGLSLDPVRGIQQRSMHRVIFIAVGFFITAAILLILLYTRQRFGALQVEHRKIRSYTDLVLDNIADAVVATDAVGTVTVLNQAAAQLFGIETEEGPGRRCDELCADDAFLLRRTREQSVPVAYEETALRKRNGETRFLAVSTSLIRDDGGAVETIVAIARDMTEQRRIREQLQRRDRVTAMGELAGGIAHEIRNPLNAINIIAQRFQHEFTPAEGADEYAQLARTIRSEVQRVNNIITQFLEFARPPRLSAQPCDIRTLLSESIDIVRSQAAQRRVELSLLAPEGLTVMADREKMLQVLLNIFQNAIEALDGEGVIKTVASRRGNIVAISIADNGPGMTEEVRQKIFNLYFTTKSSGSGLGLSIVHQIVSEHGGEIHVASNEDGGSTFSILLPALPHGADAAHGNP